MILQGRIEHHHEKKESKLHGRVESKGGQRRRKGRGEGTENTNFYLDLIINNKREKENTKNRNLSFSVPETKIIKKMKLIY